MTNAPWQNDIGPLLQKQDLSSYRHSHGVELLELSANDCVDSLIGNDNAFLMPVGEERVEASRKEPHGI